MADVVADAKAEAGEAYARGDYAVAAAVFARAADAATRSGDATIPARDIAALHSNASAAHLQAGDAARAVDAADRCVAADSSWSKGYFRRAEARARADDLARAEDDYALALARVGDGVNARAEADRALIESRAIAAKEKRELAERIAEAEKSLASDAAPGGAEAKSAEDLQRAAEERDRDPEVAAALKRAASCVTAGDTDAALTHLGRALTIEPACWQASLQKGLLLASTGDDVCALEAFRSAAQAQPGCIAAHILAAQVLERLERCEEAEISLKALVSAFFDAPEAWSALALVLLRQGKVSGIRRPSLFRRRAHARTHAGSTHTNG